MIVAIVLAAGESSRMGVPKLLLPYGGSTIIETVLTNVTASRADATLVVLGSGRGSLREKIKRFPVRTAVNARFREGMLSSIQKGLASVPADCRAALIILGDQPGISPAVIDALIGAWTEGKKGLVVPVHGGRRGHPLLLDMKYRDEVSRLSPEKGLRALVGAHPGDVLEVETQDAAVLSDIDTPADYRKATN
jgi:molybdenum cofactor cytidylyltransferase